MVLGPEYYKDFKCISHRCKHNCCIGWEIDIDSETYQRYKELPGAFGKWLRKNITDGDIPHFNLQSGERCPFLNVDGLCDIITTLGEDALCQICNDHPRFRNYYSSLTEIGIGLCCEEAARIILGYQKPFALVTLDGEETEITEEEREFLTLRQQLFDIAERKDLLFFEKKMAIIKACQLEFPNKTANDWIELLIGLERLDPVWEEYLSAANVRGAELNKANLEKFEIYFSRLLVYFIYRHTAEGLYDGRIKERITFSLICTELIGLLTAAQVMEKADFNFEDLVELCRAFSAEIEYSEENIETLLRL